MTGGERYIHWTQERFDRLVKAHDEAKAAGKQSFILENIDENGDVELVTRYAHYLIEYLESYVGLKRNP